MTVTDPFMLAASSKPFQRSGSSLLGPADADHFRIKVGRYGDRWYCDPLPGDGRWPAWEGSVPSISTIKKASGSDWSFVALKRVNLALEQRPDRFNGMDFAERYEALKAINKLGLNSAAKRGTNVHLYCEAKLHGSDWRIPVGAPGHEYMPAVDAWFDQYQPELVAAEYVVIKRTMFSPLSGEKIAGYGGTPDGLLRINGELWAIDWKSRGDDSDHGAYPEEAEQVAAGVTADYMIVQGEHGAERQEIPDVAGGLIVSIRPDGARSYPIDILEAASNWTARHAWWTARLNERKPVGKPWPIKTAAPKPVQPVAPPASNLSPRTANLIERLRAIAAASPAEAAAIRASWPAGVAPLSKGGHSDDDLDRIEWLVTDAEARLSLPFNGLPPEPVARPKVEPRSAALVIDPDEGPDATDEQVAQLRARYDALDDVGRAWIGRIVSEGTQAGATFHLRTNRSMRALRIVRGLVSLAACRTYDPELVRCLAGKALDYDPPKTPTIPVGAELARLDAIQAAMFAAMAAALANGRLQLTFDDDGQMRVVDTPLSLDDIADRFGDAAA
jgi:hypothetical protein